MIKNSGSPIHLLGQKNSITYSHEELLSVATQLSEVLSRVQIMTFTGSLGAGKTTLISTMLKVSGVEEVVTSPTFTYVNLYKNRQGRTFYHFDLYRINSVDDFMQAGFDEYLYAPNSVALIEWPEVIRPLLTQSVCDVAIDYHEESDKRILTIVCD